MHGPQLGRFGGCDLADKRFLDLADVCEILNIASTQAYALVRSGDLPGTNTGRPGQWRVESRVLEEYLSQGNERRGLTAGTHSAGGKPQVASAHDRGISAPRRTQ